MRSASTPFQAVLALSLCALGCGAEPAGSGAATDAMDATTDSADGGTHVGGPNDDRLLVHPPLQDCGSQPAGPPRIRVATWNMSAARRAPLSDVEAVLRDIDADIVLLQEVDVLAERTNEIDQPRVLSEALAYEYAFASSLEFQGGDFGLAVLSRFPFARADRLSLDSTGGSEARIAFDVEVCVGRSAMRLVDFHADYVDAVNVRNIEDLGEYLAPGLDAGMIVAGDFNAEPTTEGVSAFRSQGFVDVFETWDPGPTRLGKRIDYVYLSGPLGAQDVLDARRLENNVSDHAALWIDLSLAP
jgi:endonuclease/exonuclease/phosphatase family metal-dependent hydrolase